MESAGILRDWPNFRSVFKKVYSTFYEGGMPVTTYKTMCDPRRKKSTIELGVVLNEEDHLRFFATTTDPYTSSAMVAHGLLAGLVDHVEKHAKIAYSFVSDFGYLT